ncbi:3-methyladenine DNA glycosylase [Corynebacterium sp. S7]
MRVLDSSQWSSLIDEHSSRAAKWVEPHLARRARGENHPVWDFLFEYYSMRASHLYRWNPGLGTCLLDAQDLPQAGWRDYHLAENGSLSVDVDSLLEHRRDGLEKVLNILRGTTANPAQFDCFGLHEWAMVYHTDTPRHDLPLRLGRQATEAVVDKHRIKCTHYDAFRFFTTPARPLNLTVLTRENQAASEQAGCVHANMDLFKWAIKTGPIVPGDLLLDCFELATDARRLDMEASPYDCRSLGFDVVAIETPEGKAEYVARQREIASRGKDLRTRLVKLLVIALE